MKIADKPNDGIATLNIIDNLFQKYLPNTKLDDSKIIQ